MELIRHARRRSRGHARQQAERVHDTMPRHDHDATCKPSIYDCADREWQRERSHARMKVEPLPAARAGETDATAPSVPDAPVTSAAPAPLSVPLTALFPPLGL